MKKYRSVNGILHYVPHPYQKTLCGIPVEDAGTGRVVNEYKPSRHSIGLCKRCKRRTS